MLNELLRKIGSPPETWVDVCAEMQPFILLLQAGTVLEMPRAKGFDAHDYYNLAGSRVSSKIRSSWCFEDEWRGTASRFSCER